MILIATLFFCACNGNKENAEDVNANAKPLMKIDKKQEAISILNDVNYWVKKGVREEMPPSEVNQKINPLMEKYQQILATLSYEDSIEVQEYRLQEINKIVELQIKQDNK